MNKIYEKTEKIIKIIGVLTFVCGMIVSLRFIWEAIDYDDFDAFLIAIGIIIGSFILAMMIIGFSIIIEKLIESVEVQKSILEKLDEKYNNDDKQVESIETSAEIDEREIEIGKQQNHPADLESFDDKKKINNEEDKKVIITAVFILAMVFLLAVVVIKLRF